MADPAVTIDKLVALTNGHINGAGYAGLCPAHADTQPSLTFAIGEQGGVVLHCHAGCSTEDVLRAAGMSMADLSPEPHVVAQYVYTDVVGNELYRVQRWAPKDFRVIPGLPPRAERVLYQLPWIAYARTSGATVYVVEGEKDADALLLRNHPATTNVSGADSWLPHYAHQLADCNVIVVADNDEPGRKHARNVALSLNGFAASVQLVVPRYGKDMSELLDAGYPVTHVDALPIVDSGRLQVFRADRIPVVPVEWAWQGWVPFGALTLIDGDPGDGKSTLTVDFIARWSTGKAMPDRQEHGGPWDCVLISTEDDPARTITPRLRAAGAALQRVHMLTATEDDSAVFNLGVDMGQLEALITSTSSRIVVLDPLMASIPEGTNPYIDSEVRRALAPVTNLIRRLDCALIVVRHLNKSALKAIYAGGGSIAFTGAARAVFITRDHPTDAELHVLAPIKCNLALAPTAQSYQLVPDELHGVARVEWAGTCELGAQELMDGAAAARKAVMLLDAVDYLEGLLDHTWMTWKEITEHGRNNGYTEHTLRNARGRVLSKVTNPVLPGESTITLGTYWLRSDQIQMVTGLPSSIYMAKGKTSDTEQPADTDSDAEPDPSELLMEQPLRCQVCGAEPSEALRVVRYHQPWYVVRCADHSPYSYGGS